MKNRSPEPTLLNGFKWRGFFSFILSVAILLSLLAIVYVQHKIRSLESRYYTSMQHTLVAKEEWGRLMLEKQHLTSQAMVERVAKEQLGMTLDKTYYKVVVLEPETASVAPSTGSVRVHDIGEQAMPEPLTPNRQAISND